ncbi:MAG: hypothetical protein GX907_03960 [Clostridiaceae bacterium]|nr:hypothetical protein [Clostridiaceae bacterium]
MRRKITFTAFFLALIILLAGCSITIDTAGQTKSTTETAEKTTVLTETTAAETTDAETTTTEATTTTDTTTTTNATTTTKAPTDPPTPTPTKPAETTAAPDGDDKLPPSVKKYKDAFEAAGYQMTIVEGTVGEGGTFTCNDGTDKLNIVYFEAETEEVFNMTMGIMTDMISGFGEMETVTEGDMSHSTIDLEGAALFELHSEGRRALFLSIVTFGEDKTKTINEIYSMVDMTRPES